MNKIVAAFALICVLIRLLVVSRRILIPGIAKCFQKRVMALALIRHTTAPDRMFLEKSPETMLGKEWLSYYLLTGGILLLAVLVAPSSFLVWVVVTSFIAIELKCWRWQWWVLAGCLILLIPLLLKEIVGSDALFLPSGSSLWFFVLPIVASQIGYWLMVCILHIVLWLKNQNSEASLRVGGMTWSICYSVALFVTCQHITELHLTEMPERLFYFGIFLGAFFAFVALGSIWSEREDQKLRRRYPEIHELMHRHGNDEDSIAIALTLIALQRGREDISSLD